MDGRLPLHVLVANGSVPRRLGDEACRQLSKSGDILIRETDDVHLPFGMSPCHSAEEQMFFFRQTAMFNFLGSAMTLRKQIRAHLAADG